MPESPLSPAQLRKAAAIAAVASPLFRVLASTLRWRVEGMHHYDAIVASGKQPIFVFWHGRILPAILFWRNRGIVVMISENFDGEWIARIIRRFGYRSARGSTSRSGARALAQLRRELTSGHPVGFTLDGPRGPARVAQAGAVWLAGATGHPLLPFHIEANRAWTMGSWDASQIPRPFSTVAVTIGRPIGVDRILVPGIEVETARLVAELCDLEARARALLTRSPS